MNYAGKFDATFASEGPNTHPHAYAHVDSSQTHAPADAIIVPDAQLLFHADYSRSGTDLILSRDHHDYVVHDYFTGGKRAPLASPDGAHLTADIVKALVGEVDVSQAGNAPAASQVIGHVTKLQGSATVIRNGVSVILNMGDNVEKGDVVQSGDSSTVGITFIDGTVFGLSSNARMVLNEMIYDPNGSSNSSLLSLVAGTITFVAGETAKHGDMKVDTPVATMGIRGTAVLVEIDFSVPGQSGLPNANFQVLVEPDGTTGSYILFDKNTLQPLAIVNQAGQQININNGIINITTNPLTPDLQKLITDVFQQKFTDNTNPNTKSTSPSTDSIIPVSSPLVIKTAEALITAQSVTVQGSSTPPPPTILTSSTFHIPGPPIVHIGTLLGVETTSFLASGELAGVTGSLLPDGAVGSVAFNDINTGDRPSVTSAFNSFTYTNAHGQNVTGGLSALQLADIAATAVELNIVAGSNNTNVGTAVFAYGVADEAFDFLAAGEQLTLTYLITVNENYAPDPTAKVTIPITITITGTNDAPVITTSAQSIAFAAAGTKTVGGDLQTKNATSGTLKFTDADLTDSHTVATKLTSAVMSNGGTVPPLPDSVFEAALSAVIGTDSTGTGDGTINWQLAPLPVYLSDFIPPGQSLTLTYTITVTDSQGATSTQTITVTIGGDNSPAVVWIHTTTDGHDNLWTTANNWETGTVPTSSDDVIIITDQLHPNTPAYPVTIDGKTTAAANSVTMNDFVNLPPELDVAQGGSLAIGAALSMSADSVLVNAGTITVGGKFELLDSFDTNGNLTGLNTSIIVNSGTLKLGQGGDIMGAAAGKDADGNAIPRVTNTGLIDLTGGTLNVAINIANSATDAEGKPVGGQITVEDGAKLALGHDPNDIATINGGITGGTVTIIGELDLQGANFVDSGTLSNSGNVYVTGLGNAFDAETVTNSGTIEVKSGAALAIDQGSSVSGNGTITIDGSATLTLNVATIDGNTVTNGGAIDITGAVTLQDKAKVTNSASTNTLTVESVASLTLNDATISGGTVTNKGTLNLQDGSALSNGVLDNGAGLFVSGSNNALHDETITNNALEVLAGAVLTIDLGSTVDNSAGTVTVDSDETDGNATLNLNDASITGGDIVNSGVIQSTGGGSITCADITNSGTIESTGGTLTIDPATPHKLTNSGTVKASGGELDISGEDIGNSNALEAVQNGTLKLSSLTVTNIGGTVSDTSGSAIDLSGVTINGGTVTLDGTLNSTSSSAIHGATINVHTGGLLESTGGTLTIDTTAAATLTNSGTVEANGGELDITTELVSNSGTLQAIDDSTLKLSSTTVTNTGTVSNTSGATIDLVDAAISGGTVTVAGLLDATGTSAIDSANITVTSTGTLESTGGKLTIDPAVQTFTLTNSGTVEANGGELDITTELVTNNNLLQAVDSSILKLSSTTVTNKGTVSDAFGSTIDLAAATINGGTVTLDGTLNSASSSAIHGATINVDSSGVLESTGGTLTIDTVAAATLTNAGTVEANGGELDITTEAVSNSGTLQAINDGTLKLGSIVVTNTGTVSDDSGSTIDLASATINGGTVTVAGTLDSTGDSVVLGTGVTNTGTIEVQSGTLDLAGGVTGGGDLIVDAGATLELAGADAETVTLQGGAGTTTLELDSSTSVSFNGTITANATAGGTFAVTGQGSITTTSGDGLDFNSSGGTTDAPATVTLNLGGAIAGAANGIVVTQTGTGTIAITNHGVITGTSAQGILVDQATNATGSTTITNIGTVTSNAAAAILVHENTTGVATIDNSGRIGPMTVAATTQAIFEDGGGVSIDNTGTIDGTINVADGTFTNEAAGTWNDGGSSAFGVVGGTGFTIDNYGTINLSNSAALSGTDALTIDNTNAINSNGTDSISGAGITNTGAIAVKGGSLTLTSTTVTNSVTDTNTQAVTNGTLSVAIGATLVLSDTEIIGGTIDDNSSTGIDVTGNSKIDGNATLNDGGVTVESSVKLTLDNVTVNDTGITDKGTVVLADTVKLTGGATIQGQSSTMLGAITNLGLLEILGAATLLDVTVANGGHNIQVDSGQTLDFDNSTIDSGTLTVNGEMDSTGTSFITGATIINKDNIHVVSGTLTIDPSPVTNTGTIEAMTGATLVISQETITNHTSGGTGTIQVDGTLDLQSSEIDGGNITIYGELDSSGNSVISGATIVNDGTIDITGGNLTIDATSVLSGTGSFKMDGGSLTLDAAVVGNIEISGTAQVELGATCSTAYSSLTVTFDSGSTGTLKLDHAEDFSGTVVGFTAGETLDLANVDFSSKPVTVYTGDASGGVLAVYDNGVDVANINLTGDYRGVQWVLSNDGQGGTDVRESTTGVLAATLDHSPAQQGVTMHVTGVTEGGAAVSSGITYAWQTSVDGQSWATVGTGSSFTPGEAQEGHYMQLVVFYTTAAGTQDVVYGLGMPNDLAVTVDQTTAQQGLPIHVTSVTDGDTPVSRGVSYLWETSADDGHTWTPVGHSSSYTPSFTSDGGKLLQLVVSYSDPGESESVTQSFGAVALAKEWTGGSHSWENGAAWSPANAPTSSDNAVVDTNGHVTIDQSSAAAHTLVENASQATVEIDFGAKLTLGGNLVIDQGHFQVDWGGTLTDIASSATISGSFTNNGTVEAGAGSKLEIAGSVSGLLGSFKIDPGATLQLDHASSENVAFSNHGTLVLEDPTHFSGIVSDSTGSLTNNDVLDLAGFDSNASVNYIGGTAFGFVVVSENHKVATIEVGANSTHWTTPVSDGHGGILIKDPVQNDAAPNANISQAWSSAGADGFVFKTGPGANVASDADHSLAWSAAEHPDSVGKLAQLLQNHQATELQNIPGLHDTVTPDSLKTQLLSHHNEFHFV